MRYSDAEAPTYAIHEAIIATIEDILRTREIRNNVMICGDTIRRDEKTLHTLTIGSITCRVQKHGMVVVYVINRDRMLDTSITPRINFLYTCHYADPAFDVNDAIESVVKYLNEHRTSS